ncbi:hypothetical protein [Neisseria sicca]|nr:hypothetical protein [Neisseria sicca]
MKKGRLKIFRRPFYCLLFVLVQTLRLFSHVGEPKRSDLFFNQKARQSD